MLCKCIFRLFVQAAKRKETQKNFLLEAKRGEFLLSVDSKNRLRIWIRATELEREMMGEGESK